MHTIQTPGNKIEEHKVVDLMFTGFRIASRANLTHTTFTSGEKVYGVDITPDRPNMLNNCKTWNVRLYTDGQLIATGYVDEFDL